MNFTTLVLQNIFNIPLICFLIGVLTSFKSPLRLPAKINHFLTIFILFCIGLKGGGPLAAQAGTTPFLFSIILGSLIVWGLLQPVLAFYLLKKLTRVDSLTIAAIAASFGSVSVMTFVTAISFLDQIQVDYQQLIIAVLAIMEIPAIISGLFLAKIFVQKPEKQNFLKLLKESFFNKAILSIVAGLLAGLFFFINDLTFYSDNLLLSFKPMLCLFLFDMGLHVGLHRHQFKAFSLSLNLFGIYMPLIGGSFGLLLSYLLNLDVGTGTLIAVLTASASYIAVPAAMRVALPQAKEAVYLPLSLGIAFPFNVLIGIPLYYYFATRLLLL